MPELEAIAAPTHNAPTLPEPEAITAPTHGTPALPLHGGTISKCDTRLRRPTLISQLQNPETEPHIPTVKYVEVFAGVGSMSSATEARSGEIAMLTEKEPVARENLRCRFPDATIYDDIADDPDWSKFRRKPETTPGLLTGPLCHPCAPTGKGGLDSDPSARFLLESVGDTVKKLRT